MGEEKIDRVEERIQELNEQREKLRAFLGRLLRAKDKEECKELLGPWMSRITEEEQGTQVSYLIWIDNNGDIVDYSTQQKESYQGKDWDLNLSIEADPFAGYDRLKDLAVQKARGELDYIEREIENSEEYKDALMGNVAV